MDETRQELDSFIGREVYSSNGTYIGEIEDLKLDIGREAITGLAVGGLNRELFGAGNRGARGIIVPYRWVRAVNDVVLVSEIIERTQEPDDADSEPDEEAETEEVAA